MREADTSSDRVTTTATVPAEWPPHAGRRRWHQVTTWLRRLVPARAAALMSNSGPRYGRHADIRRSQIPADRNEEIHL
nr:hypothetical protein GCM10020092_084610 [Actinoplanes digitatis]